MPILKCTQFTVSVCMGAHFLVYVFRVDLYLCAHNQSYFLHFKRCNDFGNNSVVSWLKQLFYSTKHECFSRCGRAVANT